MSLLKTALILSSLSTFTAYAGIAQLESFYVGGDCSPQNTNGYITAEDDMAIEFFDFNVNTTPQDGYAQRQCEFTARVKIPQGFQLAINKVILEGESDIPQGGSAMLASSYAMNNAQGDNPSPLWVWRSGETLANGRPVFPEGYTSFSFNGKNENVMFSPCGETVEFSGNLSVSVQRGMNINRQASVVLTDAIGNGGPRMAWDWQLRPCGSQPEMPASYDSFYEAANGQRVHSKLSLDGPNGSYQLRNGQTGFLFGVQYFGERARGFWSFQGQNGWFDFEFTSDMQSFSGTWGYGNQFMNPQGSWAGVASN